MEPPNQSLLDFSKQDSLQQFRWHAFFENLISFHNVCRWSQKQFQSLEIHRKISLDGEIIVLEIPQSN